MSTKKEPLPIPNKELEVLQKAITSTSKDKKTPNKKIVQNLTSKPITPSIKETKSQQNIKKAKSNLIRENNKSETKNKEESSLKKAKKQSTPMIFPEFYAPEKYQHPLRHSKKLNFMIGEDSYGSYLYGEGPIVAGAYDKFLKYVNHYKKQGIHLKRFMLHSPGGILDEGIKIGEYILNNKWSTDADKYMRCYSTCGFIYAAGTKKRIQSGAEIGFHRPYLPQKEDTPEFIETVYYEYQSYWKSVGGTMDLYDKFMRDYGRDEMLILNTNNIDNYIYVEKY
ncbi:hypothetical protein LZS94_08910 [Aliivibrio fischeri]|uniref:hypothetical protein n=1 Tax=Aliivibrio fischeri TaxID=668 RepID=UPI001F2311FE|nr:hypothetical protein [Aliivibrio fischeri]MCE7577615.1 hypothetical protein [Aliivibrio fischeri]MCE7589848.1 hypothetical protein [Aliivibrio fischeri]